MKLPTPLIGNMAYDHQPRKFQFPQREFGKTSIVKRSFQQHGLGCTMMKTKIFVHCCLPEQSAHCLEKTFISTGFSNWKDAIAKIYQVPSTKVVK